MVTKTRTEYETVEKEVEVTICDCCGEEYSDDLVETVAVNPEYEKNRRAREMERDYPWISNAHHDEWVLPQVHNEYRSEVEEVLRRINEFDNAGPGGVSNSNTDEIRSDIAFVRGELDDIRQDIDDAQSELEDLKSLPKGQLAADCTFDVCHGCLEWNLGVVPAEDHVEGPDVVSRDIEIGHKSMIGLRGLFFAACIGLGGTVLETVGVIPTGGYIGGVAFGVFLTISMMHLLEERLSR